MDNGVLYTSQMNIGEYCHDIRLLAEWVPYVQSARDPREQNMDVILRRVKDGGGGDVTDDDDSGAAALALMYFRVTRDVTKNAELRIWYSEEFAALIHVPECKEEYRRGAQWVAQLICMCTVWHKK